MLRRPLIILWIACWPTFAIITWNPLRTHLTRAAMILCAIGIILGLILFVWKHLGPRYVILTAILLAMVVIVISLRGVAVGSLRSSYVQHLLAYRGVPYVWGGENGRGVDCSGLVRAGLIDAEARQALDACNPGLLCDAASLWWFKCNAKNLRDGYRNQTSLLFTAPALDTMDYSRLLPGDFAVTADGSHTLAYIGDATWIQADPISKRVMTFNAQHDQNDYLRVPMHIMRWRQFDPVP